MLRSIHEVQSYRRDIGNDENCLMNFVSHRLDPKQRAFQVDACRRAISHYFKNIHKLYAGGLLDEVGLRTAVTPYQVKLFLELEPFDAAIEPGHKAAAWEWYAGRFGLESERAAILENWKDPIARAHELLAQNEAKGRTAATS